jgi:acetolactate synthase small subunit
MTLMTKIEQEATERHVLMLTVDNEAGILAKIAGFSPRAAITSTA